MTDREKILFRQFEPPTFIRWRGIRFSPNWPWPKNILDGIDEHMRESILFRKFKPVRCSDGYHAGYIHYLCEDCGAVCCNECCDWIDEWVTECPECGQPHSYND